MTTRGERVPATVLVTGASSGIGRVLSIEYARRGAEVMAVARRERELVSLCAQIEATGGRARPFVCDVSDPIAVREMVNRVGEELGSLEMVIANAGVGVQKHASRLSVEDVCRIVDVNVRGAMATLVAAIPIMLRQKRGHLVGISSLAGRRALPTAGAYSASKAALSTFLETLRLDLSPSGIGVTDVQPGFVDTPMAAGNAHPRPFLWDAPKAARVIADRLERGPRIVAFPFPLAFASGFSRLLPYPIYAAVTRAASGRHG